jgi:Tol biopolymer transport system component
MLKKIRLLFAIFVLVVLALACANPVRGIAPTRPNVETVVAATFQALTASASEPLTATSSPEPSSLLPHSMYFLNNDSAGILQVYRLEKDGKTVSQLTFEPAKVDYYDASLLDGRVVYVSNNQMFMVDAGGANRRKLLEGGVHDENSPFLTDITNPVWSPNDQMIAYGQKGLNFYSLATGQSDRVLEDQIDILDGGYSFPRELYWPENFNADGSKLLITIGYLEGASAAIYNLNGSTLVRLNGSEGALICCGNTEWTADGSTFYAANPSPGMYNPGLWRVDASTGNTSTLYAGDLGQGTFNLASSPTLGPDGLLYYFFARQSSTDEFILRPPLQLVRSAPDGVTNRTVLRPETYELMNEALWSPDASFVIIAEAQAEQVIEGGMAKLVYTDPQKETISLIPFAMNMKWGP